MPIKECPQWAKKQGAFLTVRGWENEKELLISRRATQEEVDEYSRKTGEVIRNNAIHLNGVAVPHKVVDPTDNMRELEFTFTLDETGDEFNVVLLDGEEAAKSHDEAIVKEVSKMDIFGGDGALDGFQKAPVPVPVFVIERRKIDKPFSKMSKTKLLVVSRAMGEVDPEWIVSNRTSVTEMRVAVEAKYNEMIK